MAKPSAELRREFEAYYFKRELAASGIDDLPVAAVPHATAQAARRTVASSTYAFSKLGKSNGCPRGCVHGRPCQMPSCCLRLQQ